MFSGVQPGPYNLTIRRNGFKQVDFLNLLLNTQDHVQQNFRLQIGSVSESVTVNANQEHMESDSPAIGVLVNRDFVENMPLNGRSFQDLIALAPGTVSSPDNSGLFNINGQRSNANYYSVDGVAAGTNPTANFFEPRGLSGTLPAQTALGTTQTLASVDALQEFKIQTSGYAAEYGRQPGGQVALTTRLGTNDVHGSLFDYFRNEVLDASSWFNNNQVPPTPKSQERQNDFGATLGGPLRIPRIYNGTDKTFYFVSYEGLRLKQPFGFATVNVPTLAFREFSAPGVRPFLNASPLPNGPDNGDQCAVALGFSGSCTAQWHGDFSNPSTLDAMSFRLDQIIGQKFQIFVRYSDTPSTAANQGFPAVSELDSTRINAHAWTIGFVANLKSSLNNDFRANYTASVGGLSVAPIAFEGAVPYSRDLVVPPQYAPNGVNVTGVPLFFLSGADSFSSPQFNEYLSRQHQLNLVDGLTWVKTSHTLTIIRRLATECESSVGRWNRKSN